MNRAANRLLRLFPDPEALRLYLGQQLGREVTTDELAHLGSGFLSPLQRAYLNAAGCDIGIYPKRKRSTGGGG